MKTVEEFSLKNRYQDLKVLISVLFLPYGSKMSVWFLHCFLFEWNDIMSLLKESKLLYMLLLPLTVQL